MIDHLSQTTELILNSFCVLRDIDKLYDLLTIRSANFQMCPEQADTEH